MRHYKLFSVLFVITISFNSFSQSRIVVQKGERYQVVATSKLTSSAEVMGQTMETTNESKSTTLYDVKDVESSEIKLEFTITQMKSTASAMGQEMSYDSEKKDNSGPLSDQLSKMLNKTKTMKLDSKGMITKQDVAAEEDEMKAMGLGGPGSGNSSMSDLFVAPLIGVELKAGQSYPYVSETKGDKFSSHDSGYYKITSIENGIVNVSYSGTQTVSLEMEQMGQPMTVNSNNTVKSELQMDASTGRVLVKASVIDTNSTVEVSGMSIPATGKTTVTMTVTQLK